jgi:integrase
MAQRRTFGSIRRRSSGRWQAVYWHEGKFHSVGSFPTKADADAALSSIQSDLSRGSWIDPKAGKVLIKTYGELWLTQRTDLALRTRELYEYLLKNHISPTLGSLTLQNLSSSRVRSWNAELAQRHPSTAAKAYRLLSTMMRTAVADGLILTSPCRVSGAGVERASERPLATVAEVQALVDLMPESLKLVVLLATWCQLRRGEILGLRRCDIDILHKTIRIEQSRIISRSGDSIVKSPKTSAGRRSLVAPSHVLTAAKRHLERFTAIEGDAFVFTTEAGEPLPAGILQRAWSTARSGIGRPDLHFHDLRHTGLTLAAATGATTAELMRRAGHASADAALRYQHATNDRDQVLAEALEKLVQPSDVVDIESKRSQA